MSQRAPQPQLPNSLGAEWAPFRQFCTWVAQKLGAMPGVLVATSTWDPANVIVGASVSTTVSVPGARVGDPVMVGFGTGLAGGMILAGTVESSGVVAVTLANLDGSPQNFGKHALTVVVWRRV